MNKSVLYLKTLVTSMKPLLILTILLLLNECIVNRLYEKYYAVQKLVTVNNSFLINFRRQINRGHFQDKEFSCKQVKYVLIWRALMSLFHSYGTR